MIVSGGADRLMLQHCRRRGTENPTVERHKGGGEGEVRGGGLMNLESAVWCSRIWRKEVRDGTSVWAQASGSSHPGPPLLKDLWRKHEDNDEALQFLPYFISLLWQFN